MAEPAWTSTRERTEPTGRPSVSRGTSSPGAMPGYLLALQRTAGNAAVQRLVSPPSAAPPVGTTTAEPTVLGVSEGAGGTEVPTYVAPQAAAIDADTDASVAAVRASSQQRRSELLAQQAQTSQGVDAGFSGAVGRAGAAVDGAIGTVGGWLRATAGSVINTVTGAASKAAGLAAGAATRIRSGAAAVRSTLSATVGGVASGVLALAQALPIPNLPGVGRIRTWVLGAAQRVAGRVRSAIDQVTGFLTSLVAESAGLVESMARSAQAVIRRIGTAVQSMIDRGLAAVVQVLRRVVQSAVSALRDAWTTAKGAVQRLFGTSAEHIAATEQHAVAQIRANREDGRANLDVGSDPATDTEEVDLVRTENAATVARTAAAQGGIVAATRASAAEYGTRIWAGITAVGQRLATVAADILAQVREAVTAVVRQAFDLVRGYAGQCAAALGSIASTVLGLARAPVTALVDVGRSVADGVRSMLRSVVSRIRELLTGGPSGGDESTVTAPLSDFGGSRLRSAAGMASPPAAAAALAIPIVIGVEIGVILWWATVVVLVLAVLYLLYVIIREIARARPRPIPRERERERARRRRRRTSKPFRWNLRFLGGILDWNGKLDPGSQPIHGHHSWPKYVGGAPEQPLFQVRHDIHLHVIHPELHAAMNAFATSKGFPLVPNARATAFIDHLRANPGDRAAFAAVITAYYLLLHTQTDPGIPPSSYGAGIAHSLARL